MTFMTDAARIARARQLVAEIAHALDCADLGRLSGDAGLREASLIAAMLAANDLIHSLGGAQEERPWRRDR